MDYRKINSLHKLLKQISKNKHKKNGKNFAVAIDIIGNILVEEPEHSEVFVPNSKSAGNMMITIGEAAKKFYSCKVKYKGDNSLTLDDKYHVEFKVQARKKGKQ